MHGVHFGTLANNTAVYRAMHTYLLLDNSLPASPNYVEIPSCSPQSLPLLEHNKFPMRKSFLGQDLARSSGKDQTVLI